MGERECWFCHKEVETAAEWMPMILGFEKLRTDAGGANMVHLRERLGPGAHVACVQLEKGKQVPTDEAVRLDVQKRYRARAKR